MFDLESMLVQKPAERNFAEAIGMVNMGRAGKIDVRRIDQEPPTGLQYAANGCEGGVQINDILKYVRKYHHID